MNEPVMILGAIAAGVSAFIPTIAALPGTVATVGAGAMGAVVAGILVYIRSKVSPVGAK